jgi:hypothetical protein
MKKWLFLGGFGLAGFGLYRYFTYQVGLALNYDYNIKNFHVLSVEGNNVNISVEFDITNKSSFEITLNSYDLEFYFKDVKFGSTLSNTPITILPSSKFTVKANGTIDTKAIKESALTLASDIISRKPINIQLSGNMKVKFLGFNYTLKFDKENFEYTADLLKSSGIDNALHSFALKNPKIASVLKIK